MKKLLLASLLLAACGGPPGRGDQPVSSVSLESPSCVAVAVLVGGSYCGGELTITYSDGKTETAPVSIYGASAGLGLEVNLNSRTGTAIAMQIPDERMTRRELFGRYEGTGWSLIVGAGARGRELANAKGAEVQYTGIGLGIGFWIGKEWLWVRKR